MNGDQEQLMELWSYELHSTSHAHYKAAERYRIKNIRLGVIIIIITTAVGVDSVGLFENLFELTEYTEALGLSDLIKGTVLGLFSFLAAGLVSYQTLIGYGEKYAIHKDTGAKYSALNNKINHILSYSLIMNEEDVHTVMGVIRKKWDTLRIDSPTVPEKVWKKEKEKKEKEKKEKEKKDSLSPKP